MKRLILLFAILLVLPTVATAIPANVLLTLESSTDGGKAPPIYGFRLDGLYGDTSEEWTFNFSHASSAMTLFYDDVAGTIDISGVTWGGEDTGNSYAGGGNLWSLSFHYDNVIKSGNTVEVLAAFAGSNVGTIKNLDTNEEFDLVDYAGSHSNTFQCLHNGKCSGWVNHSGAPGGLDQHLSASDWRFVIGEPKGQPPIPEPSSAVLFGLGALAVRSRLRRRA